MTFTQAEARKLARRMGWLARTTDQCAGRWESTHEWVVLDPNSGEVFASREDAALGFADQNQGRNHV